MAFDCDGVLWHQNVPIPGAREAIQYLRNEGKKVIFVTNNSTKSRTSYLEKFKMLDFAVHLEEIFSSSYCAALYLQSLGFDRKVYVIGSLGITGELDHFGIDHLPVGPDLLPEDTDRLLNPPLDPQVGAVLVGYDIHFNYYKLTKALLYLRDPECLYVATNSDNQYPVGEDRVVPGTGAIVASVTSATGREPIVVGKPYVSMLRCIQKEHPDLDLSRCLMIGDRLDTDIVLGRENGMKTLLVLSGVTGPEKLESLSDLLPDYYLPSLKELAHLLADCAPPSS